jgi:hypothetical protein
LYHRLKFAQTAAELNGVPSWNLTPRRNVNVQVLPSRLGVQRVANFGCNCVVPGFSSTRPS